MKRKLDSRGRPQPERRTTPAELARRRDLAAQFYLEGFTRQNIADALGVGASAISTDLAAKGVVVRRGRPERQDKPPQTPWHIEDMPKTYTPHYLNSLALSMIDNATEHFERQDAINLLAFDAHDAARANDEAWVASAVSKLSGLISYLHRMQAVLSSQQARERVMHGDDAREDVPALRLVENE